MGWVTSSYSNIYNVPIHSCKMLIQTDQSNLQAKSQVHTFTKSIIFQFKHYLDNLSNLCCIMSSSLRSQLHNHSGPGNE